MDAKDLYRMNVIKLREEAMKIPGIQGVTAMKKEQLIRLLAETHGIVLEARKGGEEEMKTLKKRIRALKAKRDEAPARKDRKATAQIRQGIHTLKRRTRQLARAMKQGKAVATTSPTEPTAA